MKRVRRDVRTGSTVTIGGLVLLVGAGLVARNGEVGSVDVHNGRASFTLNSDRGGSGALTVTLQASCDVAGAIEVPTDKPGTVRFDAMPTVDRGFEGTRTYRFEGGCVTYRFDIESERAGPLVDEGSLAIGFLTRAEVQARMDQMERS